MIPKTAVSGPQPRSQPGTAVDNRRTPAARQGFFCIPMRQLKLLSVDADENGAGTNVGAEDNGLVSVVAAMDRLAVARVDSDVGHA